MKMKNTRETAGVSYLAAGLVFISAGVVLGSMPSVFVGALVVRYRNRPEHPAASDLWIAALVLALVLAMVAWEVSTDSKLSLLFAAIPLMLSYVFDYLDERLNERGQK